MTPSQVIVLATPVFFLLIGLEYAWGIRRGRNTYRLDDAISSIGLGMLSQVSGVLTYLFRVGIYTALYGSVALWRDEGFWTAWYGWLLALVFYDFCYYWQHRASHRVAILWAAHVVHHQSEDYNLSTALRQPSTAALLAWIFYVPMALAGVPPLVFGVVALIDLLYQFWVHTEHVPRLGWFDRWFCSPSNHRVHHAVNDEYLDRNHGGILIVWDRLFGTFAEEQGRCVYGTRAPLRSWDPLWSNAEVYWALAQDSWHARRWSDKLRVWLKPPGWRPADVAERFPRPAFDIARVQRFEPPLPRTVAAFAALQFALLLAGSVAFLWFADGMPLARSVVWLAVLTAGLWGIGAVMQGRLTAMEVLALEAAALATATSAEGLQALHLVFKPLAMVLAIAFVLLRAPLTKARRTPTLLLAAALAFCLAGDVFLMLRGYFIPGLVSFLVAHLVYIALFRRDAPWFASKAALGGTLALAAAMYAYLWPTLAAGLRIPVAAYAMVIALMAAQALGRAKVLADAPSRAVAAGALLFMLSDSLLAINRFATPLPLAQLWVLASYYAAQLLIVHNTQPLARLTSEPAMPAVAPWAPARRG